MKDLKSTTHVILVVLVGIVLASCSSDSGSTQPNTSSSKRYVGEAFGGGVVFYTWKDARGVEHGLVASISNQSDSCQWSNVSDPNNSYAGASSQFDGRANTAAILAKAGHTRSAALLCDNYKQGGFDDWYLPTVHELSALYLNVTAVNSALASISGSVPIKRFHYWSSFELGDTAYSIAGAYVDGQVLYQTKANWYSVRAIRSF